MFYLQKVLRETSRSSINQYQMGLNRRLHPRRYLKHLRLDSQRKSSRRRTAFAAS